ncbi:MAG: calcium-binding protein [Betaproteobacteria bacterium]|nr:MAG: calcium-binding protein [Betaproteobacteria bacterium]
MAKPRNQPDREERILFEIVVDAYNETERAMGWYYYLQNTLQMPFTAKCRSALATSPLKSGDELDVIAMATEDECMSEVFVVVKLGASELAVPLAQLECTAADEATLEAVADWHYWVARGYQY